MYCNKIIIINCKQPVKHLTDQYSTHQHLQATRGCEIKLILLLHFQPQILERFLFISKWKNEEALQSSFSTGCVRLSFAECN